MLEEMDLRSSNKLGPKLERIMAFARLKKLPSTFFLSSKGNVLKSGSWGGLGNG
jgi:hypothetical protein